MAGRESQFMQQALELAAQGAGRVSPNPMVGAVLVSDGKVVGRGYHRRVGRAHAEVEAIREAGRRARGAALFVTLEPCCHQGRTPPCVEAIRRAGIARVVAATKDPDPLVAGRGLRALRRHGVKVQAGLLEAEARRLNEAYFKHRTTGRPLVILKVAATLDGMIATAGGESRWITDAPARRVVHRLRDRCDAILVGVNTINRDDPQLTARFPGARDPIRIVVDSSLYIDTKARVLRLASPSPTWLATTASPNDSRVAGLRRRGVDFLFCRSRHGQVDLGDLLEQLGRRGVLSVLVEGGPAIHSSFVAQRLADKLMIFYAPRLLGGGSLPMFGGLEIASLKRMPRLRQLSAEAVGPDLLVSAYF